jgi:HK97 family phage portal protein
MGRYDLHALLGDPATSSAPAPAARRATPIMAYQTHSIQDVDDPVLIEFLRGRTSVAGVAVSDKSACRNSTFYRGCFLIAGSIGMLPIHLMRRKADGTTEKAKDHPLFKVLHRRPNSYQTAIEFKSYMQLIALLDGNAYALVVRTGREVRELIPLPRRSVTPKLSSTFGLTFEYRRPSGGTVSLQQRDVFCFRSPMSLDGLTGMGLLDVAADTLGLAMQAQRATGKLFTKGVMAGGSLETDQSLGEEAIDNLKESLAEDYSGTGAAGDWMVLEEGLKAKPFAGSAKDAQLAEAKKHEAEEVSRFTGVPRPLLMFDETSWGSGIEQLGLFFVTYCLLIWFVIWEEAIWRLLDEREQEAPDGSMLYAKFNERALLRGSMSDQADFMSKALGAGGGQGWMTPNEARENFDQNPKDGGDDLPRPGTTAGAILEEKIDAD